MMNLGGHIDRNGMVDSMANPHLKDALMKHRNFIKLPAAIRSYISAASSLDLNRLRTLLPKTTSGWMRA